MENQKRKPFILWILWSLLFLLSIGGLLGGILLIIDPTGSFMHFPPGIIEKTLFHSFAMPGIILLIFNGIIPGLAFTGMVMRPSWKFAEALNVYHDVHWSWTSSLYCGIILVIWINVQILFLGYIHPIQMIYSFYGLVILIMTLIPGIRNYYLK